MQSKLFRHDRVILVRDDFVDTIILEDGERVTHVDPAIVRERRQTLVDEIQAIDELLAKIDNNNYDEIKYERSAGNEPARKY